MHEFNRVIAGNKGGGELIELSPKQLGSLGRQANGGGHTLFHVCGLLSHSFEYALHFNHAIGDVGFRSF